MNKLRIQIARAPVSALECDRDLADKNSKMLHKMRRLSGGPLMPHGVPATA